MIIIGEKLNSSVPKTLEAIKQRDAEYISESAARQTACGADYIDINTALTGSEEADSMSWMLETVCAATDIGVMLDSPDPGVLLDSMRLVPGRALMINSVTLDDRFDALIQAAAARGAGVVCLPIESGVIPATASERLENAARASKRLTEIGVKPENIYIDILVQTSAADPHAARVCLETLTAMKKQLTGVKTVCGLSNCSFGLPGRARLNAAFLSMAYAAGLDAAILDITSERVSGALRSSAALLGDDDYCMNYIKWFREINS